MHLPRQFSLVNDVIIGVGVGVKRDFPRGIPRRIARSLRIDRRRGEAFFLSRRKFDRVSSFSRRASYSCTRAALLHRKRKRRHCRFRTADNHLLLVIEALCCLMRRESTLLYDRKIYDYTSQLKAKTIARCVVIYSNTFPIITILQVCKMIFFLLQSYIDIIK